MKKKFAQLTMKILFFFTSLIIIVSVNGLEEIPNLTANGSFNFYDKLQTAIEVNLDRYRLLRRKVVKLQIYENKFLNFTENFDLESARIQYYKIIENATIVCILNKQTYEIYKNLSVTNNNTRSHERIKLLSKMIKNSLNKTSTANNEINEIEDIIKRYFFDLTVILNDLEHLAYAESAELMNKIVNEDIKMKNSYVKVFNFNLWKDDDEFEQAEREKYKLEQKALMVNRVINDTKMYAQWVQKVVDDLVKILEAHEFWGLEETLLIGQEDVVDHYYEKEDLSSEEEKQILIEVDNAVKDIYEESCLLAENVKVINRRADY